MTPAIVQVVGEETVRESGEVVDIRGGRWLTADTVTFLRQVWPHHHLGVVLARSGNVVTIMGPGQVVLLDLAYPGCSSDAQVAEAEEALRAQGLTRGLSPAGRAADWIRRTFPQVRQGRLPWHLLKLCERALYGGHQQGSRKEALESRGVLMWDRSAAYAAEALRPLPHLQGLAVERGWRRESVLLEIRARQAEPILWSLPDQEEGQPLRPEEVTGWYPAEEVTYWSDRGALRVLEVSRSITARQEAPYLEEAVSRLYEARQAAQGPGRDVLKSALVGLVGRYALRLSAWRMARPGEEQSRALARLEVASHVFVWDPALERRAAQDTNFIWTALVTARARLSLAEKIREVEALGGRVVWAHTDAVAVTGLAEDRFPGAVPAGAPELGAWRLTYRGT